MTTYTGTQNVEPGLYFNTRNFRVTSMEARGELPGTDGETYRRVPMLIMLAAAPLLGLAFLIFLPFIGFAMVAGLLGQKALQAVGATRVARAHGATPLAVLGAPNADTTGRAQAMEDEHVEKK